ncbi:MAG: hypothetical protein ACK4F4_07270 [Hylemonella sp.]|uniref:hypothetical protein n=1 Tax=Hylemonella sp. TaxID=2066020 RepID=UPI003918D730
MQPSLTPPQQLNLLPLDEEEVMRIARRLFDSSRLLQERWPSFDKAMAHPLVGRCLLLNARQVLRSNDKKKGRRARR